MDKNWKDNLQSEVLEGGTEFIGTWFQYDWPEITKSNPEIVKSMERACVARQGAKIEEKIAKTLILEL